jgi:hypothetical protein
MKDLAHHIKKLNRRIIRSIHHMEMEEANFDTKTPELPNWKRTDAQKKKQAKTKIRQERSSRAPIHKTEAERNWEMKHRVPVFDRTSHPRPKITKPTKKKTPRI